VRLTLLLFAATAAAAPIAFREHVIATDLRGGYQVIAVDVNRDGKPDLVALASGMPELVWFENPTWERHVIAGGFKGMINVAAIDVDGDGVPELVLAHGFANQAKNSIGNVSVLEHQGDPRGIWNVREIDRLTTSHRLRVADLDGSGRKLLISAPLTGAKAEAPLYRDHTPLVFYRPGEWKREVISNENQGVVHGIFITDWNGDGKDEILTASFEGIHVFHRRKDGTWERTQLTRGDPAEWPKGGSSDIAIGHAPKRFIAAIEPWHGNQVVVYHARGRHWIRYPIDPSLQDGHTILTGDFTGEGRDEIVAGFRGPGRSVYIYTPADRTGTHWSRSSVDEGGIAAAACTAADLNGDGSLDLACIGSATANLKWYENNTEQRRKKR
jgi:hypothetical protein